MGRWEDVLKHLHNFGLLEPYFPSVFFNKK
nr:MAG TPA: hypothetical protein [Caudoviricetes sp.]